MNYADSTLEKTTYESTVNLENLNLKIYTGAQFGLEFKSVFGSHLHIHIYHEIFYVKKGRMTVKFKDKDVTLEKNDIIIIPPNISHCVISATEEKDVFSFFFDISKNTLKTEVDMYGMFKNFLFDDEFIHIKNNPSIAEIADKISKDILITNHYSSGVYFCELLIEILQIFKPGNNKQTKKAIFSDSNMNRIHIIDFFIKNRFTEDISLDGIADILCLSKKQTGRIILKHYGICFRELIVRMRMMKAGKLLLETNKSASLIATEIGYASLKGFYYIFKKYYGMLPSEYRERNIQ